MMDDWCTTTPFCFFCLFVFRCFLLMGVLIWRDIASALDMFIWGGGEGAFPHIFVIDEEQATNFFFRIVKRLGPERHGKKKSIVGAENAGRHGRHTSRSYISVLDKNGIQGSFVFSFLIRFVFYFPLVF